MDFVSPRAKARATDSLDQIVLFRIYIDQQQYIFQAIGIRTKSFLRDKAQLFCFNETCSDMSYTELEHGYQVNIDRKFFIIIFMMQNQSLTIGTRILELVSLHKDYLWETVRINSVWSKALILQGLTFHRETFFCNFQRLSLDSETRETLEITNSCTDFLLCHYLTHFASWIMRLWNIWLVNNLDDAKLFIFHELKHFVRHIFYASVNQCSCAWFSGSTEHKPTNILHRWQHSSTVCSWSSRPFPLPYLQKSKCSLSIDEWQRTFWDR